MKSQIIACFGIFAALEGYVQATGSVAHAKPLKELDIKQRDETTEQATEAFFKQFEDGGEVYYILKMFELLSRTGSNIIQPGISVPVLYSRYVILHEKGVFQPIKTTLSKELNNDREELGMENATDAEFFAALEEFLEKSEAQAAQCESIRTLLMEKMMSEVKAKKLNSEIYQKLQNVDKGIKEMREAILHLRAMIRASEMLTTGETVALSLKGLKSESARTGKQLSKEMVV